MKREDFIFAIGFDGNMAFVDKKLRSTHRSKNTKQLADAGLFPVAYRSAVYDGDNEATTYVLEKINEISPLKYRQVSDLDRLFGVQKPDFNIKGVIPV